MIYLTTCLIIFTSSISFSARKKIKINPPILNIKKTKINLSILNIRNTILKKNLSETGKKFTITRIEIEN